MVFVCSWYDADGLGPLFGWYCRSVACDSLLLSMDLGLYPRVRGSFQSTLGDYIKAILRPILGKPFRGTT